MVGRNAIARELDGLLSSPGVRLVTLAGPGGIGKTWLATRVPSTWSVSLADVAEHELVSAEIARVLGLTERTTDAIVEMLRDEDGLLVLDNFEHVLDAAPVVERIVSDCEDVTVLVTSIEPLRLPAEQVVDIPPMTPDEAAALFVDRATAVFPSFTATDDDLTIIEGICERLGHMPLAIELAASRVNVLTPKALSERLDRPLDLLTKGTSGAPSRHQTLRAAIAWTYDLLTDDERAVFVRVAAFSGGCRLDALAHVASSDELALLDALGSLVDRSLVRRDADPDGEPRFRMLDTIRAFGREHMDDQTMSLHAAWFTSLAARAEPLLKGPGQGAWLDRLEHDHDNLRAAYAWSMTNDPPQALALASCLWEFWRLRGYAAEGVRRIEDALRIAPRTAKALNSLGLVAWDERSLAAWNEALTLAQDDRDTAAQILHNLGTLHYTRGELDDAERLCAESLKIRRELGERRGVAETLNSLGAIALARGDPATARTMWTDALRLRRELSNQYGVAEALGNLAVLAYEEDDPDEATRLLSESLSIRRTLGDKPGMLTALVNLGSIEGSRERFEEALAIAHEVGDASSEAQILALLDAKQPAAAAADAYEFVREGEYWSVRFGGDVIRVRDTKGVVYIAELLRRPGAEVHVLDLAGAEPEHVDRGDAGEVLDAEAKRAYKERITELEEEIAEAREFSDLERASRAEDELDALTQQLAAGFGLGGRERRAASVSERARLNVSRAVKTAIKAMQTQHAGLGAHLETTVNTGTFCSYRPDPRVPIVWRIER